MDEEIKGRLTSYLETLEQATSTASEFVVAEAPAIAQEYLAWVFWSNLVYVVVVAIALVLLLKLVAAGLKETSKDILDQNVAVAILGVLSLIAAVIFLPILIHSAAMLLKVTISPRLVLLEKVSELVN